MTYPAYTPTVVLRDLLREEIIADAPFAYYPLDDPSLSTLPNGWAPTTVPGCVAWLNPDGLPGTDGSLVTSAPAVGTGPAWSDIGSSGAPYLKRNGLNGRSYVHIEAFRGLVCDVNLTGANTVFVVARMRGTRNGRLMTAYRNNWLLGWHGTKEDQYFAEGWVHGDGAGIPVGPTVTTNLLTYCGIYTAVGGNDSIFYRNGVKLAERSEGTQGPNGLALAGYMVATNGESEAQWSDSDVYEVIAYDRVLTSAEMTDVHNFLAERHKTFAPTGDQGRRDVSGNGRTATVLGAISKGERPLLNRGFSARFSAAAHNVIQAPFTTQWPEFSVEVLVRPEGAAANEEIVSKRSYYATTAADFPFALTHSTDDKFSLILDQGDDFTAGATITTALTYPRNVAHHVVAVVRNNGLCELFVNGASDGSTTIAFALPVNARQWSLGAPAFENGGGVGGLRFTGRAQHWAIYDKALTEARVQAHYAAVRPTRTLTRIQNYDDLVVGDGAAVYWPLHDDAGSTTVASVVGPAPTVTGGTFGVDLNAVPGTPGTGFQGSDATTTNLSSPSPGVLAAFTQEMWVKPATTTTLHLEQSTGTNGVNNSPEYAIHPEHGGASNGGVGWAVGTNGVVVYAHGDAYLPSLLMWSGTITDWAHLVVVVENRTPRLYVNGTLVRTGVQSPRNLLPSRGLSGTSYGGYSGRLMAYAQYNLALTDQQIADHHSAGRTAPTLTRADVTAFLAS